MWQTEASVAHCHICESLRSLHSGPSRNLRAVIFAPGCQYEGFHVAKKPSSREIKIERTSADRGSEKPWEYRGKDSSFRLQFVGPRTLGKVKKGGQCGAQPTGSSVRTRKLQTGERQDGRPALETSLSADLHRNRQQNATEGPSHNGAETAQPFEERSAVESERRAQVAFQVRQAANESELSAAAWLRAEVYADGMPYTRFVDSYKKQFADQELGSLLKRTRAPSGRHLKCCCLVAVEAEKRAQGASASEYVIGTLDASLKQLMPGERIPGEVDSVGNVAFDGKRPVTKARKYAYISNLCVSEHARRKGVARLLMAAATQVVRDWGELDEVFCHVDIENTGAQRLYKKLGYEKWGEVTVQENASAARVSLQRILLLRAELTDGDMS